MASRQRFALNGLPIRPRVGLGDDGDSTPSDSDATATGDISLNGPAINASAVPEGSSGQNSSGQGLNPSAGNMTGSSSSSGVTVGSNGSITVNGTDYTPYIVAGAAVLAAAGVGFWIVKHRKHRR